MRARFAVVLPIALLALGGCACDKCAVEGEEASPGMFVNETCPIGGEAVMAEGGKAEYKGNDVGFCCPGCKAGWEDMSEADKDAFITKAKNGDA
ncbi:MAG: hypothetical protein ACIAQ0_05990 [Phycisphaerales bacterium JB058]|jgi:hypothetical protein